jgi:hypothetical protein
MKTHNLEPLIGYAQSQLALVVHPNTKQKNEECVDVGFLRFDIVVLYFILIFARSQILYYTEFMPQDNWLAFLLRATCDLFFE